MSGNLSNLTASKDAFVPAPWQAAFQSQLSLCKKSRNRPWLPSVFGGSDISASRLFPVFQLFRDDQENLAARNQINDGGGQRNPRHAHQANQQVVADDIGK